jgi:hypothetical protein
MQRAVPPAAAAAAGSDGEGEYVLGHGDVVERAPRRPKAAVPRASEAAAAAAAAEVVVTPPRRLVPLLESGPLRGRRGRVRTSVMASDAVVASAVERAAAAGSVLDALWAALDTLARQGWPTIEPPAAQPVAAAAPEPSGPMEEGEVEVLIEHRDTAPPSSPVPPRLLAWGLPSASALAGRLAAQLG